MRLLVAAVAGLAVAVSSTAVAQTSTPTWSVTLDIQGRGQITELAIADNGDIVVGGYVDRGEESVQASKLDGWLARYAPNGKLLWEHRIGGEYRDEVNGLAIAPDGSIYVAGGSDIQLRQSIQDNASFVSRYAADGSLIWTTAIDDPDGTQVWLTSLQLLDNGSALVMGSLRNSWGSGSDAYVAMISKDGERLWQQWPPEYPEGVNPVAPGKTFVVRSANGSVVAQENGRLGRFRPDDTIELIATQPDMGGPLPARCLVVGLQDGHRSDDSCGPMDDIAMHMTRASAPFTASRRGDVATGDGVVRKYDDDGEMLWEFTSSIDDGDGFHAAAPTPDGGAVVVGYRLHGRTVERHNWDGVLVRLDRDGKQVWRREFDAGKRDELQNVAMLPDGSIIAVGYTTPPGADIWRPWLMRLNPEGRLE